MPQLIFRRLVLNTGSHVPCYHEPSPMCHALLGRLCRRRGYVRLPLPMHGYGMKIEEGSNEVEGSFTLYLDEGREERRFATCAYCATEQGSYQRFTHLVEAYRAAVAAGQVRAESNLIRQPNGTPWLALFTWQCGGVPLPPEAGVLADAVFTALVCPPPVAGRSPWLPS